MRYGQGKTTEQRGGGGLCAAGRAPAAAAALPAPVGAPVPSGGRRQAGRSKEAGHAVGRDQRCNDWVPIFPCKAQLLCS